MTIPAGQTSITRHTGNGVATTFDYDFKITDASELLVTVITDAGVATVQTLTTDYTVTGVGDETGGSITLVAGALTLDYELTIEDNVQASQLTPYGNQSAFFASLHEASFDKLTRLVKRSLDLVNRTFLLPSWVTGVSTVLPVPQALRLIRWNGAASALENVSVSDLSTTLATSNWVVQKFEDGTDFTAGVTTQLTLSQAPGVIQNTWIFFDGELVEQDEYSLAGSVVTFAAAIPGGTSKVEVRQNEALDQGVVAAGAVTVNLGWAGFEAQYLSSILGLRVPAAYFMTDAEKADVTARTRTLDVSGAINAALNYILTSGRRGVVTLMQGDNFVQSTIDVTGLTVGLRGEGSESGCVIVGGHTNGPVVKVNNRRDSAKGFQIDADATRQAAAAGSNFGMLIEPADSSGIEILDVELRDIYIQNQPNSGLALSGPVNTLKASMCVFRNNRHGSQMDYGSLTSRTHVGLPGIMRFEFCRIFDNTGHGVLAGNDDNASNRVIRLELIQCDISRNAQAAGGGRKSADNIWAIASNSTIKRCGINGLNQAQTAAVCRGGLLHGPNWKLINNRVLQTTPQAFSFDVHATQTIETSFTLDDIYCLQTASGAVEHNPAILVDPSVSRFSARTQYYNDILRLTSDAELPEREKRSIVAHRVSASTPVNNSTTLVDDTALKLPMRANERMQFRATLWPNGPSGADIKVAFTVPSGATLKWAPAGGIKVGTGLTVVQQDAETVSGTAISFGLNGTGFQPISIEGEVVGGGTAGDLQLQFAQNAPVVGDTTIGGQSALIGLKE